MYSTHHLEYVLVAFLSRLNFLKYLIFVMPLSSHPTPELAHLLSVIDSEHSGY